MQKLIVLSSLALLLAACDGGSEQKTGTNSAAGAPPPLESSPEITAEDFAARVATLADDKMEGRAPATPGGRRASQWIADEMQRLGFKPLPGGSYFQPVPLVESTVDTAASSLSVTGPSGVIPLAYGEDAVYWTKRLDGDLSFADSELVFVGYGVAAPEYDWNDYGALDVSGKTIVMLVNDPGFATEDPNLFNGKAMTYYGRWTYKFEEAGRRGAQAALIIHETEPASYGWNVIQSSWSGAQLDLDRGNDGEPRVKLESWISRAAAERMFAAAGLDFETLKAAASRRGFKPVPLTGLTAAATLKTAIEHKESRNVGGIIQGAERPDEYVLYTAHWDHLGVDPDATKPDRIYNGAVDNGTGVAGILEIGEKFASRATPPARSVMILTVTAEESGLLGSDYFASNPVVPLKNIVGGLNIDAMLPVGPARDFVVVGYGASELEDRLRTLVEPVGKRLSPDPHPEAGSFYRSDHISLAKRGVPMLYADGGEDLVNGGPAAGAAAAADYRDHRYHAVTDEYDASWDVSGIIDDLNIFYEFGAGLADSDAWPNWYKSNEFRALRDAQRAGN